MQLYTCIQKYSRAKFFSWCRCSLHRDRWIKEKKRPNECQHDLILVTLGAWGFSCHKKIFINKLCAFIRLGFLIFLLIQWWNIAHVNTWSCRATLKPKTFFFHKNNVKETKIGKTLVNSSSKHCAIISGFIGVLGREISLFPQHRQEYMGSSAV